MFRFIKQKIINQLWLSLCLMLGISLLVATFSCRPMFMEGSLNQLLDRMFSDYMVENNKFPTVVGKHGIIYNDQFDKSSDVIDILQEKDNEWRRGLPGIDVVNSQCYIQVDNQKAMRRLSEKETTFNITYMPEILDHITLLKGSDCNVEYNEDVIPCMVTERVLDSRNLSIGEDIIFTGLKRGEDDYLMFRVVGIFCEKETSDLFWYEDPNLSICNVYISSENMDRVISEYGAARMQYLKATLLDYNDIDSKNIDMVIDGINRFSDDEEFFCDFRETLDEYVASRKMVGIMLWVMQLPILGMVFAFIYMLSNQIVQSERAEIATLKSRGISRIQVILLYAARLGILALISTVVGIPMGYGFCKLAASTSDFLTFRVINTSAYMFVPETLLYGGVAASIGVIFILLPVIKNSKISIVDYQSTYSQGKPMFFEKYFLDVLLLALSVYLWYSSNKSLDQLQVNALNASKMDPVVFLNSCLFIVAAGMVMFRLMHYLVILVYKIRKKKWKSVSYVAFLQITRTFSKQTFISIFIILTVALGLFNANAARTINRNYEDRIEYAMGTDVRIQEKWVSKQYTANEYHYIEPDYTKYEKLIEAGYCDSVTRVLIYKSTNAEVKNTYLSDIQVMGIDTKAFGNTAHLKKELYGDNHWFNNLNALAEKSNGAIVSKNLAESASLSVGDKITIHGYGQTEKADDTNKLGVTIVAITDAFPGYERYYYKDGELCEKSLVVINQAVMMQRFDIRPYEVWVDLADGVTPEELKDYLIESSVPVISYDSVEARISEMKDSPKIQVTNGMFTLSFIIAMGLCAVGFLIYWITSIGQRELLFGVYRAMGMSVRSLNRMLIYEHVFSTLLSVISGGLVGTLTTVLFIELFGVVYLPEKSNLDIYAYYEMGDVIKLFAIIGVVIIICLFILRRLIKKMNITQALKLGED